MGWVRLWTVGLNRTTHNQLLMVPIRGWEEKASLWLRRRPRSSSSRRNPSRIPDVLPIQCSKRPSPSSTRRPSHHLIPAKHAVRVPLRCFQTGSPASRRPDSGRREGRGGVEVGAQSGGEGWVLGSQGINPQEKAKLEKEPMKQLMERGIDELPAMSMDEVEASKLTKDDIDMSVKWLGFFHRRKHQYGRFMVRMKLPNGVTTSSQTRYLAGVVAGYGREGCTDVTTGQNWQIRDVTLRPSWRAWRRWASTACKGMDNVRNPVGNPLAGIDPHEPSFPIHNR